MKKVTWIASVVFLASIFLTGYGGINECFAAQAKKAVSKKTAQGQEQKKVFDAHDTNVRYHFNDTDMDFNFGTIVLGSAVNHGVEIGEAFYAASQIKDGDAASWQEEWFKMARLAEAAARNPFPAATR